MILFVDCLSVKSNAGSYQVLRFKFMYLVYLYGFYLLSLFENKISEKNFIFALVIFHQNFDPC